MKVGIYCDDIKPEDGGASTLTQTILNEIKETNLCYEFVFLFPGKINGKYKYVKDGFETINVNAFFKLSDRLKNKLNLSWGTSFKSNEFDRLAEKENIDIIWFCSPRYANISIPYIYTVWDLGHRTVPYFPEVSINHEWERRENSYKKMLPKASWILIGNNVGKEEIIKNYSVNEDKIVICPFPVSQFCYGDESKPQMEMPQEYFFYPAQFWAHKNHITVLKALELLKVKYKEEPTMFFTGSDKGNRRYIEEETERIGIDKQIVFTGFLTNQEIKYMYTHATAMVYPSLMGPNNLPPIEAVYLNCPLIVSNLDGHIEQLGDGVIYFDGTDEAQLAECLHNMLNQEYRNNVIQSQQPLRTKLSEIKYCKPVWSILEEFIKIRRCWK